MRLRSQGHHVRVDDQLNGVSLFTIILELKNRIHLIKVPYFLTLNITQSKRLKSYTLILNVNSSSIVTAGDKYISGIYILNALPPCRLYALLTV